MSENDHISGREGSGQTLSCMHIKGKNAKIPYVRLWMHHAASAQSDQSLRCPHEETLGP